MKLPLPWFLGLLAVGMSAAEAQNRVLLLPGQTLPGAGNLVSVGDFAMNSQGSWLALALSDTPAAFLVRDGQTIATTTGSVPFATTARYLDLDELGNIGYALAGPAAGDWRLMRNDTVVLQKGEILDIDGDGTVEPVDGYQLAHLSSDGSGYVYALLSHAGSQTAQSLVRLRRDAQGLLDSQSILTVGQTLPTGKPAGFVGLDRLRYRTQMDSNSQGDLVVSLAFDGVFVYSPQTGTWKTVVEHAAPAPFFGSSWSIDWYHAVGLGNDGAAYFSQHDWIARDQQIALWPATGLDFPEEYSVTVIQQSAAVRRAANGHVLWAGRFLKPGSTIQSGIARDASLVVLDGVTRVEGHTILRSLVGGAPVHDFTADGQRILFRGITTDNLAGLFEIDLEAKAVSVAGCVPKVAQLAVPGGVSPKLHPSSTTVVELSQGQSSSATGLLLVSTAGSTACGTVIPGVGEILVSVQPDQLLVRNPLATFLGKALFWLPSVPAKLELQGLSIYAQGLWFDPLNGVEPVRVSNALRLILGF